MSSSQNNKIYLCVLDFEATCEKNVELKSREIIEFPSILYCLEDGKITLIDVFQKYVKPTINPKLSDFCTKLTGITQSQVDNAETLPIIYKKHFAWLEPKIRGNTCYFITCGNWDLDIQLPAECKMKNIKMNHIYKKFLNIKDMFYSTYKIKGTGLLDMLEKLSLSFTGRQHSGFDDCVNTSTLLTKLINDGYKF